MSKMISLVQPQLANICYSASPLNNEAAQLHQNNPEEYYKKVRARHQDMDD